MPNIVAKTAEQAVAEAEVNDFRRHLGPFVVAAETTRAAMLFTDAAEPGHPIIFANDSFLKLTGYSREEVLGQAFNFLMARGDNHDALARIDEVFAGDSQSQFEMRDRRKDGSTFWSAVCINPVHDESGVVVQHFASFVDLTGPKREAEHLRFLLDELNHRTQNTLATVLAIAGQTLQDEMAAPLFETFQGRILALSRIHSLLGRDNWDAVRLHDLLGRILQPFGLGDEDAPRISVAGDDVCLNPKAALTLAMVFHELATNAAKYGALSKASGRIAIGWIVQQASSGDQMLLRWQESGGPPVALPRRRGFGSYLIEGRLAQELSGEVRIDYEKAGLVCQIVMPLKLPAAP
jgi:PAS domain S-box-containing protein